MQAHNYAVMAVAELQASESTQYTMNKSIFYSRGHQHTENYQRYGQAQTEITKCRGRNTQQRTATAYEYFKPTAAPNTAQSNMSYTPVDLAEHLEWHF